MNRKMKEIRKVFNTIDYLLESVDGSCLPSRPQHGPPLVFVGTLQSNNKVPEAKKHLFHIIPHYSVNMGGMESPQTSEDHRTLLK